MASETEGSDDGGAIQNQLGEGRNEADEAAVGFLRGYFQAVLHLGC